MKTLILSAFLSATLMGSATVYAEQPSGSDTSQAGAYVKDSVITTKVKARLAAEHITSLARIHVDTDAHGVVYLSGTAQSQEAIDTAIRLARDTEHVRGVHSDIAVHDSD